MTTKLARTLNITNRHGIMIIGILLLITLFGCGSKDNGIDVQPSSTIQSTATYTPLPTKTSTPTPTQTAIPPTPTLGIGSTMMGKDGMTLLYVPAGKFIMGSDNNGDAKPAHLVYLDAFWIDRTEVTNKMYAQCVDSGKCSAPSESKSYTRSSYYGNSQFDNYPVIYVSWDDASKYCAWAGKKLPTEAQWEKAASWDDAKKEKRVYPWGNAFDKILLNSSEGGKGDTTSVGSYANGASPYGVMDMAGNAWEWVADWYASYPSGTQRNPTGPTTGQLRVLRGVLCAAGRGSILQTTSARRVASTTSQSTGAPSWVFVASSSFSCPGF